MTITINLTPDLERQLREASDARGVPPEEIVVGALSERLKHSGPASNIPHLSREESKLLAAINGGLSEGEWQRYRTLVARRQAELLTPDEQQELIAICDRLEALNVVRLEKISQLAHLRGLDS